MAETKGICLYLQKLDIKMMEEIKLQRTVSKVQRVLRILH